MHTCVHTSTPPHDTQTIASDEHTMRLVELHRYERARRQPLSDEIYRADASVILDESAGLFRWAGRGNMKGEGVRFQVFMCGGGGVQRLCCGLGWVHRVVPLGCCGAVLLLRCAADSHTRGCGGPGRVNGCTGAALHHTRLPAPPHTWCRAGAGLSTGRAAPQQQQPVRRSRQPAAAAATAGGCKYSCWMWRRTTARC